MLKIRCIFFFLVSFCVAITAQDTHYSLGLADGNGHMTRIHTVNPSTKDTITVVLEPYNNDGTPNPIVLGTSAFTLILPPLASATVATTEAGMGSHAGFITVRSFGEMVGWTEESDYDNGGSEVSRSTSPLVAEGELPDQLMFPAIATAGAERAVAGTMIPGESVLSEAWLGIRNTRDFTTTLIVEANDAVTGAQGGSTIVDVAPNGGFRALVRDLVGSIPTGHARIQTQVIQGDAIPYISYEDGYTKAKNAGQPLEDGQAEMPLIHSDITGVEGYYAVTNQSGSVSGDATLTSAVDGVVVSHRFGNSASGGSAFLATNQLLENGLEEDLGNLSISLDKGFQPVATGFLFGGDSRATLTPGKPANRALLPFDSSMDWQFAFEDSVLMVHLDHPQAINLVATGLDSNGSYTSFGQHMLQPGANAIPASLILGDDRDAVNLLLELDDQQAMATLDLVVIGEDGGHGIMDQVSGAPLSGPMTTGNLSYVLPAWLDDQPSCMGVFLTVQDMVPLINNGMVCPL